MLGKLNELDLVKFRREYRAVLESSRVRIGLTILQLMRERRARNQNEFGAVREILSDLQMSGLLNIELPTAVIQHPNRLPTETIPPQQGLRNLSLESENRLAQTNQQ